MKDCCKTDIEKDQKQGGFKKWFNYILYVIIAAVIIGTLVFQIFS